MLFATMRVFLKHIGVNQAWAADFVLSGTNMLSSARPFRVMVISVYESWSIDASFVPAS